jgi:multisubunit Na+/H+ antiporter MnhB subunit
MAMLEARSLFFRMAFPVVFGFSQALSVYLLLRGHNAPGGGFIAGLVTALSLCVLSFEGGAKRLERILRLPPLHYAAAGVLFSLGSAFIGPLAGGFFLQHFNFEIPVPLLGRIPLGTPLLFDFGVFLVVIGVFTKGYIILSQPSHQEE